MRYLAIAAAVIAASPAQAGQPISVSMAECSGIFLAMADYIETPDRKTRILQLSEAWAEAADAEAGRDMTPVVQDKAAIWHTKGRKAVFTEEFRDWSSYCRSLARHKGLDMHAQG